MISVIIPALNEEKTIVRVIRLAKKSPDVTEVIVVDDKSLDKTVEEARKAGASVITSTKLGKHASMKDGVLYATNPIVAFLDADITTYPANVIHLLTEPIISGRAEFCKSCFSRQSGRVTELVAKPLLSILYPDFPSFWQPLNGMVAGKRELFTKIQFEEGYGVDIGLLIDMYQMGARIEEVSIGHFENKIQSPELLAKMSREIANVILKKTKNKGQNNHETLEQIQLIREQMKFAITESSMELKKIAVFDLDNTFLQGSYIQTAAKELGFEKQLLNIVDTQANPFIRVKQTARLLRGRDISELLKVAEQIPVTAGATAIINVLRENGFVVGLISDSYDCITNHFKNIYGFDFSLANELEFSRSIATGEIKIPSFFVEHDDSVCNHGYCKTHALMKICKKWNVPSTDTLAIGKNEDDACLIKNSGIGIAFCSSSPFLDSVADFVIKEPDFNSLLPIIK